MSNFLIAYGNQVDTAAVSGGSYAAGSRDELLDYRLERKARTSDATAASTKVFCALAEPAHVAVLGLMKTNVSVDASARYRVYSDAGFTTVTYDSGTLDVYPLGTIPFGEIPFGAPNWWTGRPLQAEVDRFQNNLWHELSGWRYLQYFSIEVFDTTNPTGYLEFGRLVALQAMRPRFNASTGKASLALKPRTSIQRATDGTPYFTARRPDFSIPAGFDHLTNNEALRALDLMAMVDLHGEALLAWDADDVAFRFRRSVFGRLNALDALAHPNSGRYTTQFQVEGTL